MPNDEENILETEVDIPDQTEDSTEDVEIITDDETDQKPDDENNSESSESDSEEIELADNDTYINELKYLKDQVEELKTQLEQKNTSQGVDTNNVFQQDFSMIKAKYPNIKENSVQEFGNKFLSLMATSSRSGITAVQAYEITHLEEIKQMERDAGAARAAENKRSKNHLRGEGRGGAGKTVIVPKDVLDWYRRLVPGISDKEIAKHYSKEVE